MRLLFFAVHGNDAESLSLLCRGAGVDLDIARRNRFVDAASTSADLQRLAQLGVGAANEEELCERIGTGVYDGIVLSTPEQVIAYRRSLRTLNNSIPLIIHHTINRYDVFDRQCIQNFLSPSRRALVRMRSPNSLHIRKQVGYQWLPDPVKDVHERRGLVSFIHNYEQLWPHEWKKFVQLNRQLSPLGIENYGEGTSGGVVNDVDVMRGARATVHLKGAGICCYAVIRSMALGTPVIVDEETVHRCHLDDVAGLFVGRDLQQIADELTRLTTDDDYWCETSENVARLAKQQFQYSQDLGDGLCEFLERSQQRPALRPRRLSIPVGPDIDARSSTWPASNHRSCDRQPTAVSESRLMRGMLTFHSAIEPWLVSRGRDWRHRWIEGCPLERDDSDCDWDQYESYRAQNRELFETRILKAVWHRRPVTFVKVGAHDGATGDPLHEITSRCPDWRGLLIEPVPHLFQRLARNYGNQQRFALANVAVDRRRGRRPFYYVSEEAPHAIDLNELHDQLGSFNKQHLLRHLGEKIRPYIVEQQVSCLRLSDVLLEHNIDSYDIIQIDTEGHDYNVLRQIDFLRHRPACVLFEHMHLSRRERRRALQLLEYHNYRLYDCGNDVLAVSG